MKTPENQEIPEDLISEQFRLWDRVVTINETQDTGSIYEYEFTYGRTDDPDSLFTADSVCVGRPHGDGKLEHYFHINSSPPFATQPGERWLHFVINPKDPYRSRIGFFEEPDGRFYCAETLNVYISSHGRAYQSVQWGQTLTLDSHSPQNPGLSYLREYPDLSNCVKLDQDPTETGAEIEPFQHLNRQNLEKLVFLLRQVESGNVIEF